MQFIYTEMLFSGKFYVSRSDQKKNKSQAVFALQCTAWMQLPLKYVTVPSLLKEENVSAVYMCHTFSAVNIIVMVNSIPFTFFIFLVPSTLYKILLWRVIDKYCIMNAEVLSPT
jgi:hypothetical protein